MLLSSKRHTSPAQENANLSTIAFQYQTIHLASYQYQIIQYHPKQSTLDVAGKTLIKKQKLKHAASQGTFHEAASGRYIQEKISPE
jgi:hypothetical protein